MISQKSLPSYRGHLCARDIVASDMRAATDYALPSIAPLPFRNDARCANASGSGLERGVAGGYF